MVSVWGEECQECKSQKSKLILFNDILLNEISDDINGYLCCNDCCKMLKVINDPIYKTLNEEQQMIFKFVRLFPFPKNIKALKEEFSCASRAHILHFEDVSLYLVNKGVFSVLKYIYENLFMDWKEEAIIKLIHKVHLEFLKITRKPDWSNYFRAYDYIFDIITDLIMIYKTKSRWGRNIFNNQRRRRDYTHPAYHKYIKCVMGNDDVSSLKFVIHKRIGFWNRFS